MNIFNMAIFLPQAPPPRPASPSGRERERGGGGGGGQARAVSMAHGLHTELAAVLAERHYGATTHHLYRGRRQPAHVSGENSYPGIINYKSCKVKVKIDTYLISILYLFPYVSIQYSSHFF